MMITLIPVECPGCGSTVFILDQDGKQTFTCYECEYVSTVWVRTEKESK